MALFRVVDSLTVGSVFAHRTALHTKRTGTRHNPAQARENHWVSRCPSKRGFALPSNWLWQVPYDPLGQHTRNQSLKFTRILRWGLSATGLPPINRRLRATAGSPLSNTMPAQTREPVGAFVQRTFGA